MASRPSSTLTFRDALLLLCGVAGLVAWARYTGLACDAPADPDPAPLDTASDDTLADASITLDLTSADTSPHDTLAPPNDLNGHHTDASTDLAEATAHSPVARCATVAIPERVERLCPVAEPPCPLEEAWLLSCEDAHALRMIAAPDGVVLATETRALPTFATQYEAFRFVPQQAAVRDGLWVTGRGVTNAWSLLPRPDGPTELWLKTYRDRPLQRFEGGEEPVVDARGYSLPAEELDGISGVLLASTAKAGKTAFLMQLADGLALRTADIVREDKRAPLTPVFVCSEMSSQQLAWRSIARWTGYDSRIFRAGRTAVQLLTESTFHGDVLQARHEVETAFKSAKVALDPGQLFGTSREFMRDLKPGTRQQGPALLDHVARLVGAWRRELGSRSRA